MHKLFAFALACTGCSALLGVDKDYDVADGGSAPGQDSGGDDSSQPLDATGSQDTGGEPPGCLVDFHTCSTAAPSACCSGECTGASSGGGRCCSVQLNGACGEGRACCSSVCNALGTCVVQCRTDGEPCASLGDCCHGYQCSAPEGGTDGGSGTVCIQVNN